MANDRNTGGQLKAETPLWRSPGVLFFTLALVMSAMGLGLLLLARSRSPVRQATLDGLYVELVQARWVEDQMPHDGLGFARPAVMMPDMPDRGFQRLSVELALHNTGGSGTPFRGEEFSLLTASDKPYTVNAATLGAARLDVDQSLNTVLFYDVQTIDDPGPLKLVWRRGGKTVYMSVPPAPEHVHAQPRGDVTWPPAVTLLLPIGNRERGERLYRDVFGCAACHGDPTVSDSNNVGPHLGKIALEAVERIPDMSGLQYIYESILQPNDFIAPECRGLPCAVPSAMPDYSNLLALQEMADLIAYLAAQTG